MARVHPILDYAASSRATHLGWVRDGDAFTLTVPPRPFWPATIAAVLALVVTTPFTLLAVLLIRILWLSGTPETTKAAVVLFFVGTVGLWLVAAQALRRAIRSSRTASTIRVSSAGLTVAAPRSAGFTTRNWGISEVIKVSAAPPMTSPRTRDVRFTVMTRDRRSITFRIAWPVGEAPVPIEEFVNDVLGLRSGSP